MNKRYCGIAALSVVLAFAGHTNSFAQAAAPQPRLVLDLKPKEHGCLMSATAFLMNEPLLARTSRYQIATVWAADSYATQAAMRRIHHLETKKDCELSAFSPDRTKLAVSDKGIMRLWDVPARRVIRKLSAPKESMTSVDFSPDGKRLVTLSKARPNAIARVWNAATGRLERTFPPQTGYRYVYGFSPDGTMIVDNDKQGAMQFWNAATGRLMHRLKVPPITTGPNAGTKVSLAGIYFSHNTNLVATSGSDGLIRLWNARTGKLLRTLRNAATQGSLALSGDGKRLAAGNWDETISLWDAGTLKLRRNWRVGHPMVWSLKFLADGATLVSVHDDGMVKVWDARNGRLLLTMLRWPRHRASAPPSAWIAFTPAGYYTGSPGVERHIRWKVGRRLFDGVHYRKTFHRPDMVQRALRISE